MDLRKHKRFPAHNGSREILLDITKNFINPSHYFLDGKEEEEEEEESKDMTEVFSSSQVLCRNGNHDPESSSSPPCRRRTSIKDSDDFHRKPPLALAMDSPVFTSRPETFNMSIKCELISPQKRVNQRVVSSDLQIVTPRGELKQRELFSDPEAVLPWRESRKMVWEQKVVLPQQGNQRLVSDPEVVLLPQQEENQKVALDGKKLIVVPQPEESNREVPGGLDPEAVVLSPQRGGMKDEEDSDNKDISVPQQGDVNQKEARARNLKLRRDEEDVELSVVAFVFDALRRSGLSCKGSPDDIKMDIGRPTDVRHIAHVTFDRFNGFLGLPAEFQMQIPRIAPSASVSAFGVSAQSMQCSYDRKGNSVPTILLLLQERLYDKKGLRAEGIFRINAENSQEEHVRSQLNHGVVPHNVDVHCLAGMIKAWFRELPRGVLDSLSPDQVMQCNSEEQAITLMKTLPPMERGLLDWGINLMADVVHEEHFNKMNAHNIAMVFAPNMTQVSDPLIALMHAVQVMNLLKMLILRTLRDRNYGNRAAKVSDSVGSFRRRDSIDGCDSSHDSRERYTRRLPPKYEYEFFVERQGSSSNASKPIGDNTTMSKLHNS